MGYYGNLELKHEVQELRKNGKSYNEIIKKLGLSKSTVSDWCKNVQLTNDQLEKLYLSKKKGALKGSFIAAERKKKNRVLLTERIYTQGLKEVGKLSRRDRFIAGIALYVAEGTKIDKSCCLSNSDPLIIKFMIHWFREFCNVPDIKFRGAIWLHEGLDELKAKQYWSKLTDIPLKQFYKTYIAKDKIYSNKIRKNKHIYGVFSFYVNDTNLLRKIMGWIGGVLV